MRYLDAVRERWGDLAIWDYLRYDDAGQLWINGLRVTDAVRRYGSPLEVVDTTVIERRAREWRALTAEVADEVGYGGGLDYLYAAKANMASEVVHAAYRAGWGAETSAAQDLDHLRWLEAHDLLPPGLRVVCNGFKLPPACYSRPQPEPGPAAGTVALPSGGPPAGVRGVSYAEQIVAMARDGWRISPVLDRGELDFFAAADSPALDVGLRLKFGPVATRDQIGALDTRFGLPPAALRAAADRIWRVDHLQWTTLHAMVAAATEIPVPRFVESLLVAARLYAELRQAHPTLNELNIGGGIPPLGERYDHRALLRGLMVGLRDLCSAADVPPPTLTFELGSLVAAEGGFHLFGVVQDKPGSAGGPSWALIDGGLMAAIPDMLLIDKQFRVLAVDGAKRPAREVVLGDLTCDADGRYPPADRSEEPRVLLPTAAGATQHVVIPGVGAYQEILSGVRGAHHCGLLEAVELILERRPDGAVHGRVMPRQTSREAAILLGYAPSSVAPLRAALDAAREDAADDGRA